MNKIDFDALTRREEGDERRVVVKSHKTYKDDEYYVTIRLTDFLDSEITEREDEETGEVVRGIFIPFEINDLLVTRGRKVYCTFRADLAQVPSPKYTHLLSQVVSEGVSEKRKGMGFLLPTIGHMRPKNFKQNNYKK